MKLLSPAKINLVLDVLGKDSSGYHKIQTVFHQLNQLVDVVEIVEAESDEAATQSEDNLALKALKLIKQEFSIKQFAQISILKNIPPASGLGGASSNAAATLKGLNELWNLKLSQSDLLSLGAFLGMDVPFFIVGGTALGENFGEKITPLPHISDIEFGILESENWAHSKVSFDNNGVSANLSKTGKMYSSLNLDKCGKNTQKTAELLKAITEIPTPKNQENINQAILLNLHNDFEQLYKIPPNNHLTGSGPATFTGWSPR